MEEPDYVDTVAEDWSRVYTDVDLSAHYLALRILRTSRILQTKLDAVVTQHGFTVPGDFEVLTTLRRSAPAPVQPSELADRLMITTAGMTGRLDRLESAGLISRNAHPSDRRGIVIQITEKGFRVAEATFVDTVEAENAMFDMFSQLDRVTLSALLRGVLNQAGDAPAPRS